MGLARARRIAAALLGARLGRTTPAAILWAAGTAEAVRWIGTLAELAGADAPDAAQGKPGTIVVGAVVGLAATLGARMADEPDAERDRVAAAVQGGA